MPVWFMYWYNSKLYSIRRLLKPNGRNADIGNVLNNIDLSKK